MSNDRLKTTIRTAVQQDISGLKDIIDSNSLFPSEMLSGMMHKFFNVPDSKEYRFVSEHEGSLVGIAYSAPERLTDGTYNLYLIAIRKTHHGQGIGSEMMAHIENMLKAIGQRILLVETSGFDEYALTRKFYTILNYTHEATIRDFYQNGEDKIIFWKKLT